MVIIDMGRPDRLWHVLVYGRFQSPIVWDVLAVATYMTGSLLYLYLPLIPDLAILRHHPALRPVAACTLPGAEPRLARYAGAVASLERAISIMAVVIIPVAVSVHTVVSWLFGMTLRPGWHSTIFGPYFVVGAIFSGIAALLTAMALFVKFFALPPGALHHARALQEAGDTAAGGEPGLHLLHRQRVPHDGLHLARR